MTQLKPSELARRWNRSTGTLRNWRCEGKGPKYLKISGRVRYPLLEIVKFEKAHLKQSTRE